MNRYFEGLEQFAAFLETSAALQDEIAVAAAGLGGQILYKNAMGIFGDASKLEDLAPSTQDERERLGYSRNEPLLRDGSLLKDNLEVAHEGMVSGIGSEEPVMAYHEYGYVNARTGTSVPPRPVLKLAMIESAPAIEALVEDAIGVSLGSGSRLTIKP